MCHRLTLANEKRVCHCGKI